MSTVARFGSNGKKGGKDKMSRAEKSLPYKTYIGNTAEGQGFADKRKRKMANQYRKMESKEKADLDAWSERVKKIYAEADDSSDDDCPPSRKPKKSDKKLQKSNETTVLNEMDESVVDEQSSLSDLSGAQIKEAPSAKSTKQKPRDVSTSKKLSAFHLQEKEWSEKKLAIEKRREEMEKRAEEKKIKTDVYRKEKKQKYKQLLKRNYKGQPNMESRMKLLLEKIKKQK